MKTFSIYYDINSTIMKKKAKLRHNQKLKLMEQVREERGIITMCIRELGRIKKRAFYTRQIGKTATILLEGTRDRATGKAKGISGNYLPLLVDADASNKNNPVNVLVAEASLDLKLF